MDDTEESELKELSLELESLLSLEIELIELMLDNDDHELDDESLL